MTFEPEFEDLMPSTVQVAKRSSQSLYGVPTFGTDVAVLCRVEHSPRMVRTVDNREVVSSVRVYTAGPIDVDLTDRLTLPDGSQPQIIRVDNANDETGPHHTVVYA